MNHLLNMLDGFASILDFNLKPGRTYLRRRGGFVVNQKRLRSDVKNVGEDLRKSLSEYGKQGSSRSRNEQKR